MNCTKCSSENKVKNGKTNEGKQSYKCKDCGYRFCVEKNPNESKNLALLMYLEGLGFRAIGRILKVSHVSVFNWIKKIGKETKHKFEEEKKKVNTEKIIEMDEIHTYLGKKKLRMDMDSS